MPLLTILALVMLYLAISGDFAWALVAILAGDTGMQLKVFDEAWRCWEGR